MDVRIDRFELVLFAESDVETAYIEDTLGLDTLESFAIAYNLAAGCSASGQVRIGRLTDDSEQLHRCFRALLMKADLCELLVFQDTIEAEIGYKRVQTDMSIPKEELPKPHFDKTFGDVPDDDGYITIFDTADSTKVREDKNG